MQNHSNVTLSVQAPLPEVVTRCEQLHVEDKKAEKSKGTYLVLAILSLIVGLLALIGAGSGEAGLIVGIVLSGVAVVFFILNARASKADVDDRKLDIVRHIFAVLRPEISPKKPLALQMDFRAYKYTRPTSSEGGRFSQRTKTYRHNWLTLKLPLANGARIDISAAISAKRKEKPKPKYTKVKERANETLRIIVTPPPGTTVDPAMEQRLKAGAPNGLKLVRCRVKPRGAEFVFATGTMQTVTGRYGSTTDGDAALLSGHSVLSAIIVSYKSLEQGLQGA